MMIELPKSAYPRVTPIFHDLAYNLVVRSILEGYTIGRVFVDRATGDAAAAPPRAALIWNTLDTLLLAGQAPSPTGGAAFNHLLRTRLIPDARARGAPQFNLYLAPDWAGQFGALLRDYTPQPVARRAFRLADESPQRPFPNSLPAGLTLRRIEADLLARRELVNMPEMLGWIDSFWPTRQAFLREGLGYCLLEGETVASWALAVYVAGEAVELAAATAVAHRRRGLATLAAAAALDLCLAQGRTPHWHCDLANVASVKIAAALGFVPLRDYTVYRIAWQT
jgi:RimJ/RimL family protein N-acetyltransferase